MQEENRLDMVQRRTFKRWL